MCTNESKRKSFKIHKRFWKHNSIRAVKELGVLQLGARIDGLQKDGYTFKKEWHRSKNRYGEDVDYKSYSLTEMIEENENHIPSIM